MQGGDEQRGRRRRVRCAAPKKDHEVIPDDREREEDVGESHRAPASSLEALADPPTPVDADAGLCRDEQCKYGDSDRHRDRDRDDEHHCPTGGTRSGD